MCYVIRKYFGFWLIGAKPLRIMFYKVHRFIKDYDGTKYLILFSPKEYDAFFDRIRYLIGLKSGISCVDSHNYAKIKIDSDDHLALEKKASLHDVVILIKSVFNKNHNQYYHKTFLEKCSYQLAKKQ